MAKIDEKFLYDHSSDKIIHKKTYDNSDAIKRVHTLNTQEMNKVGSDYKFVGSIPLNILGEWIKEAGLSWDDNEEIQEIIKRKLMSGDFDKLLAGKKYVSGI
jgi:poly-D-alanine transfer protein DltD